MVEPYISRSYATSMEEYMDYSALIVESPSTLSPSRQKLSVPPPRSESSTNNVQPGCNVVGNSVNICLSTLQFTGSCANEGHKHGAQVFHRVNHQLCAEQNQISVDCSGTIVPQTGPCTARVCVCVRVRVRACVCTCMGTCA